MSSGRHAQVIVVGAGAFGGWTALNLLNAGVSVTLVDAWGAGNPLSSSGGESRVIRHVYDSRIYVDMTARALELWKQADRQWGEGLFHRKGVLFMSRGGDFLGIAAEHMAGAGVEFDRLDRKELATRFPQINTEGLDHALFEPGAGYLDAKRACEAVRDAFIRQGGEFLQAHAKPGKIRSGVLQDIVMPGGSSLHADQFVFACGPWMSALFPDLLADGIRVSRQEVYFFRVPSDQQPVMNRDMPVWADLGESLWYGIPAADGTFKLADDAKGPTVDPDTQSREPSARGIESARQYMKMRFPLMGGAELVDSRVCQYSLTNDDNFILDKHPLTDNVWLVGGGSGHGFKHGPAMGELAAGNLTGAVPRQQAFALVR